jgi:hypothetical protein
LLQGTKTFSYRAQKRFVTAQETLYYRAQKHFVTAPKNTLLQYTKTLFYRAQKHFFTESRNILLQGTETLCCSTSLQRTETLFLGTETLCYSAEKHFHGRRKRSEKRKHIHPKDGVLIRRTVERMYVLGDWIMPAP